MYSSNTLLQSYTKFHGSRNKKRGGSKHRVIFIATYISWSRSILAVDLTEMIECKLHFSVCTSSWNKSWRPQFIAIYYGVLDLLIQPLKINPRVSRAFFFLYDICSSSLNNLETIFKRCSQRPEVLFSFLECIHFSICNWLWTGPLIFTTV